MAIYLYNKEESQDELQPEEVAAIGAYLLSLHKPFLEPIRRRHKSLDQNVQIQEE